MPSEVSMAVTGPASSLLRRAVKGSWCILFFKKPGKLESATEGRETFVSGLPHECRNRHAQTHQEAFQAPRRTYEYSISGQSYQQDTAHEARHNASSAFAGMTDHDPLSQRVHGRRKRSKIPVGERGTH